MICALIVSALTLRPVVCVDPGHPSEVGRGTRGRHISEIQAAWQVSQRLKRLLAAKGLDVVLTKSRPEEFVRNRRRSEIANGARADLMIRLHCDAATGSGFAVYYPDRPGSVAGFHGPPREVIDRSRAAAKAIHQALAHGLRGQLKDNGLKTDRATAVGRRQGALTGSIFSRVPVVLVEMCVLTNPRDEAFIRSRQGQAKMAAALAEGARRAVRASAAP